jgi:hypothetical protein
VGTNYPRHFAFSAQAAQRAYATQCPHTRFHLFFRTTSPCPMPSLESQQFTSHGLPHFQTAHNYQMNFQESVMQEQVMPSAWHRHSRIMLYLLPFQRDKGRLRAGAHQGFIPNIHTSPQMHPGRIILQLSPLRKNMGCTRQDHDKTKPTKQARPKRKNTLAYPMVNHVYGCHHC